MTGRKSLAAGLMCGLLLGSRGEGTRSLAEEPTAAPKSAKLFDGQPKALHFAGTFGKWNAHGIPELQALLDRHFDGRSPLRTVGLEDARYDPVLQRETANKTAADVLARSRRFFAEAGTSGVPVIVLFQVHQKGTHLLLGKDQLQERRRRVPKGEEPTEEMRNASRADALRELCDGYLAMGADRIFLTTRADAWSSETPWPV